MRLGPPVSSRACCLVPKRFGVAGKALFTDGACDEWRDDGREDGREVAREDGRSAALGGPQRSEGEADARAAAARPIAPPQAAGSTLPGFMIPFGSNTRFIATIVAISAGEREK